MIINLNEGNKVRWSFSISLFLFNSTMIIKSSRSKLSFERLLAFAFKTFLILRWWQILLMQYAIILEPVKMKFSNSVKYETIWSCWISKIKTDRWFSIRFNLVMIIWLKFCNALATSWKSSTNWFLLLFRFPSIDLIPYWAATYVSSSTAWHDRHFHYQLLLKFTG